MRLFENSGAEQNIRTSEGVKGGWRKQHNEELHNFYCSPKIIRVIETREMRWMGYVACIKAVGNAFFFSENRNGADFCEHEISGSIETGEFLD
jgi:hypothetical protein